MDSKLHNPVAGGRESELILQEAGSLKGCTLSERVRRGRNIYLLVQEGSKISLSAVLNT